ncbi:MAG: sigma-54-dependent Fis family transcriptional regulator [Tidjanibacter sp.]|nr:sigma-54-dependent Fis family transcriptional regulator [Tidjanibacter sp.]
MSKKILVIDPSRAIRNTLKERLEFEGYTVDTSDGSADPSRKRYDLTIAEESFATLSLSPWIALTDCAEVERVVELLHKGADDVITRPIDMNRLLRVVRERLSHAPEEVVVAAPPQRTRRTSHHTAVEPIIGSSPRIERVKRLIERVAPSEARVLITGANGTGKELVARWLHEKSNRAAGPFIEVNCAAIPSELIESELFGHEKGAFTSAIRQRKGKFEQAIGGTLFMDEIGDMSLSAQAKVLRALQENRVSRVGSDKDIEVDVRVLAATNKNLREEIRKGNFREDLYHRLSVIVIDVPPLGERLDDIPALVAHFSARIAAEYGIAEKPLSPEAVEELRKMPWGGNIRELRNVMERLIILSGNEITAEDVQNYVVETA